MGPIIKALWVSSEATYKCNMLLFFFPVDASEVSTWTCLLWPEEVLVCCCLWSLDHICLSWLASHVKMSVGCFRTLKRMCMRYWGNQDIYTFRPPSQTQQVDIAMATLVKILLTKIIVCNVWDIVLLPLCGCMHFIHIAHSPKLQRSLKFLT